MSDLTDAEALIRFGRRLETERRAGKTRESTQRVLPQLRVMFEQEKVERAPLESLTADWPDLLALEHFEDLSYLVRRFEHETGVRVGTHATHVEALRALAGVLMAVKTMQEARHG